MDEIKDLVGRIEKRFGKEAVVTGKMADIPKFTSGSLALDDILGGGWAVGRIIEMYGAESCGKTTIAIHAAVEMQKRGRAVGYVDVEQALDPDYMKALGLDMSSEKFVLSQPDNAEDALEIAREMISTKEIGLVIIDSVAGLVPKAILQGEAGDAKVALVARLMSSQINIFKNICKKNGCTLICINQIRDKVGGGFGFGGATTTTPGGHALKFYASQRIELARIGSDKEGEEAVANRVKITCKKNKVAPPFKKCEVVIRFGVGLDKVQETLNQAILYGICSKKGAWYYYDDTRLGQGLPNTRDLLLEDKALLEDIQDTVRLFREDDKKKKEAEV
jgi:recombination protein RecA